ncbi:hypothetical protein EDC01DRAFT_782931 [Geopyxis carbonaria]|nr:hypothetical protein EDC01DRAFT_782931 [Geopyxis carbonaria]
MPSLPDLAGHAFVAARDNNALAKNLPIANNNITTRGSDLLWAICALHGLLLLGVIAWTFATNPRRRIFHYFSISILLVATIYYFVLASNLGATAVPVQFRGGNIRNRTRQVYYTRWIGYLVNFALAFFALLLMSGVGWATIVFTTGLVMLWATMFLVGELVRSSYKWGFFVLAWLLYALIVWQVLGIARSYAARLTNTGAAGAAGDRRGSTVGKVFTTLAAWELFLLALYPIAWGLSEGGNRITNDSEQIFYVVLDVLSQGIFALALLALTRTLDFDALGLGFSEYGRIGHGHHRDVIHDEKRTHAAAVGEAGHGGVVRDPAGVQVPAGAQGVAGNPPVGGYAPAQV